MCAEIVDNMNMNVFDENEVNMDMDFCIMVINDDPHRNDMDFYDGIDDPIDHSFLITPDSVGRDLLKTLTNGEHNDVRIVLDDGELSANKCILAARSEYFAAMFNNKHQFTEVNGMVKFPCKKKVMERVLEYLYAEQLDDGLTIIEDIEILDIFRMM